MENRESMLDEEVKDQPSKEGNEASTDVEVKESDFITTASQVQ